MSYQTSAGDRLLSTTPSSEITVQRSASDGEPEGHAVTGAGKKVNPLGGVLHWLMLPSITPSSIYSRILSYQPAPRPPLDGAKVQSNQRLGAALSRGLRLTVVCNRRCTSTAIATIDGGLARSLHLGSPNAEIKAYRVGTGSLGAGAGIRTLTITFTRRASSALRCLHSVALAIATRSTDPYSHRRSVYKLSATLRDTSQCPSPTPPARGRG